MVRAGMPLELVARQLGHRDIAMVAKVYGRFVPNSQERDRWEAIAAALDAEKWGRRGALEGAPNETTLESESLSTEPNEPPGGLAESGPGIRIAISPPAFKTDRCL
jgi:hypothetical protein